MSLGETLLFGVCVACRVQSVPGDGSGVYKGREGEEDCKEKEDCKDEEDYKDEEDFNAESIDGSSTKSRSSTKSVSR